MGMTGLDSFGAMLLSFEIDVVSRFASPKRLVSWMGLCLAVHQSGNSLRHGKMKKDEQARIVDDDAGRSRGIETRQQDG